MNADKVHRERGAVYGDYRANMTGTSQQIAGLLTQMLAAGGMTVTRDGKPVDLRGCVVHLPAWAAPLIMGAVKLNRMASGVAHEDNVTDAVNYMRFALGMQAEPEAVYTDDAPHRRYQCERCGGTGQQQEGCWDGEEYAGKAGTCAICNGEGLLGVVPPAPHYDDDEAPPT